MRVFVFFLMMAVAMGGLLGGYRAITGRDLVSLSDFGVGRASARLAVTPPAQPALPIAAPASTPSVSPTQSPAATATPVPSSPRLMSVGNTDGLGVYLRKTPHLNDRLRAWVDGTKMEVTDSGIQSDGLQWFKVRAPDGIEGYIPQQFLVQTP